MNLKDLAKHPILGKGFEGEPTEFSMGQDSPFFKVVLNYSQQDLNDFIKALHKKKGVTWSISGDRENRIDLYRQNKKIMKEGRTVHIGVDVCAPAGTPLHAPCDCEVVLLDYEKGKGTYGYMSVLKCLDSKEPLYLVFGHLAKDGRVPVGSKLRTGDVFAYIGDFHENGNWLHHTHLQVLTQRGFDEGWIYKALCTPEQLPTIDELCPSPMAFIYR
jgi:murein DD-endopeptidase MepM/ murein hydrolase activator NlpD